MKNHIQAVVTGDIVSSTAINDNYQEILQEIASAVRQYQEKKLLFEVFRGDSFQVLVPDPVKALRIALLFRVGLRRHTIGKKREEIWDARLSIGIGTVRDFQDTPHTRLGMLDGEAFVSSGRGLDSMKEEGKLLKITVNDPRFDEEFDMSCTMADAIIGKWSTQQADAIYYLLLEHMTQKEIGKKLNKSQRAIGKRLEASSYYSLLPFLDRYEKIIEWKYNS